MPRNARTVAQKAENSDVLGPSENITENVDAGSAQPSAPPSELVATIEQKRDAEEKPATVVPPGYRLFVIHDGTSCFSHGGERFPVTNGHVILPEAAWYQDLVKAGTLTAAKP